MLNKKNVNDLSDGELIALFEQIEALIPTLPTQERLEIATALARALLQRVDKLETKVRAFAAERDMLRSLINKSDSEVTAALLKKTGDAQLIAETVRQRVDDIPHAAVAHVCEFVALHAYPDRATESAMGTIHAWLMYEATTYGVNWRKHDTMED